MFCITSSKPIKFLSNIFFIFLSIAPLNIYSEQKNAIELIENSAYEQACVCDFCEEIHATGSVRTHKIINHKHSHKNADNVLKKIKKSKRTIIIYMAADNDLRIFAARNIQQMAAIGSNENISILVHLDIRISGNKKITRRYLIEKDKVLHI